MNVVSVFKKVNNNCKFSDNSRIYKIRRKQTEDAYLI